MDLSVDQGAQGEIMRALLRFGLFPLILARSGGSVKRARKGGVGDGEEQITYQWSRWLQSNCLFIGSLPPPYAEDEPRFSP